MKTLVYAVLMGSVLAAAAADQTLDESQVNALLEELTAAPKHTWLEAGTIRAKYLEYRIGEEMAYESQELFRFDGNRFYWEIVLADPPADAASPDVERPDHQSNKHRIFAYDGNAYTRYYKSADYAVVVMDQQEMPMNLFGPFTAGVIPWGLGLFTREKLAERNPSAAAFVEDGRRLMRLTLTDNPDRSPVETTMVLDPEKAFLPLSYTMKNQAVTIRQHYRDYRQIGQNWIPFIIVVERFHLQGDTPTLVSYEDWRFLSVDANRPTEPYQPVFAEGTVVELQPYGQMKSFLYHASEAADITRMLEQKVMTLSVQKEQANCAVLAVAHIAKRFAKNISLSLPETPNPPAPAAAGQPEMTSLYAIRQALEAAGLYCAAVKTDVKSLAEFKNYGIILHFPTARHYVVLDRIEKDAVWTVDLTDRKFYWKRPIRELLADWKDGVALLVADQPIVLSGQVELLDDARQQQILGGNIGYSCTELIQNEEQWLCSEPIGGLCGGAYYRFWLRYGCREDYYGTTCTGQKMIGYDYTHCINHPYYPNWCEITGRWYSRYIRACM